ncbi:hypothetical protein HY250_00075 [Candidatus Azambacteria bacterium]|nr:hypothetical protein [Candidatus Azambacteria bacterium]MBI3684796.1 hypothetical protein [Candidatus Azambacteria bacterium]
MKRKSAHTVFLGVCPVCRKKLRDEGLAIIDKNDAYALCCVTCVSCLSSLMFTVSSLEGGMVTTVGVLTDIQEKDLEMVKRKAALTHDDVLDIHAFLENK